MTDIVLFNDDEFTRLVDLPVHQVDPDPDNIRKDPDPVALAALGNSLLAVGQINPIIVFPTADERYQVVTGTRRLLAARIVGLKTIRAIIVAAPSKVDHDALNLTENLLREDILPIEKVDGVAALFEANPTLTAKELSKKYGIGEAEICKSKRIKASPAAYQALVDGKSINSAYKIAKDADRPAADKPTVIAPFNEIVIELTNGRTVTVRAAGITPAGIPKFLRSVAKFAEDKLKEPPQTGLSLDDGGAS